MIGADTPARNPGDPDAADREPPFRRQPEPGGPPVLSIDGFEGPLDWLLELARTRRVDLTRLSIGALVAAFEDVLTAALAAPDSQPAPLGRWGGWLVMAADLTVLRSRLLVPADTADAQDARAAAERLRRQLADRAAIGTAADWLETRPQLGRDVFARGPDGKTGVPRAQRVGDITALLRACLAAIRLPAEAGALPWGPGPPFWTVADAARRIRRLLPTLGGAGATLGTFLPAVPADAPDRDRRCRVALSGTFLAGLEMTRGGDLTLEQSAPWGPIQAAAAIPG